ncbi:MAG: hypothetical protein EAX86_10000 [Candidatus Heimdallarchaeota archaeon]|nr:hypothetical protein [Candidatus Heimdallarchaeota archaeon]
MSDLKDFPDEFHVEPSKAILLILTLISITASLIGIIIVFSIFTASKGSSIFYFGKGFILGFLLLLSGTLSLFGIIIVERARKNIKNL